MASSPIELTTEFRKQLKNLLWRLVANQSYLVFTQIAWKSFEKKELMILDACEFLDNKK